MRLCIDLCSGLGGFSQAFVESPDWEVVRIDVERKFNPTICADVRDLSFIDIVPNYSEFEQITILASPPCERFSIASHTWPRRGIRKAFEVVGQCCEIIADARDLIDRKSLSYAIENPKGRLRWYLGKPSITIRQSDYGAPYRKLTDVWSSFDLPMIKLQIPHTRYVCREANPNAKLPLKAVSYSREERSKLPFGLSQAVLEAVSQN